MTTIPSQRRSQLWTLLDVWSGYAVTTDARRGVMLGVRSEPSLLPAAAEPGPLMTRPIGLAGPAGMALHQLRELNPTVL